MILINIKRKLNIVIILKKIYDDISSNNSEEKKNPAGIEYAIWFALSLWFSYLKLSRKENTLTPASSCCVILKMILINIKKKAEHSNNS